MMFSWLFVESFILWVVSATYRGKHDNPSLADNLRDALQQVLMQLGFGYHTVSCAGLNLLLPGKPMVWDNSTKCQADPSCCSHAKDTFPVCCDWEQYRPLAPETYHFVLALAAFGLVGGVLKEVPHSAYAILQRVCLTITLARMLRTVCFATTVLPSAKPLCYKIRFGKSHPRSWEPPEDWYNWIRIGLIVRGDGGCNDLLFSGHCVICIACIMPFREYYPHSWITLLLWCCAVHAALESVIPRQHHSVDYAIGVPITILIWETLAKRFTDEARRFTVAEVKDAVAKGEGIPTCALFGLLPIALSVYYAVALIGA